MSLQLIQLWSDAAIARNRRCLRWRFRRRDFSFLLKHILLSTQSRISIRQLPVSQILGVSYLDTRKSWGEGICNLHEMGHTHCLVCMVDVTAKKHNCHLVRAHVNACRCATWLSVQVRAGTGPNRSSKTDKGRFDNRACSTDVICKVSWWTDSFTCCCSNYLLLITVPDIS